MFPSSSLAAEVSSSVLISTPFFFWFLGPLLTPVNKNGEVIGTSSSASQSPLMTEPVPSDRNLPATPQ